MKNNEKFAVTCKKKLIDFPERLKDLKKKKRNRKVINILVIF